jgi:hypothetical protein
MRYLMLVASLAILAGCSQAEESEPVTEAPDTALVEPAPALAADGQPTPGLYRITTAQGEVFTEDVRDDGTYVQTDADGTVVETGSWEQPSPDQYCYTVDADTSGERRCNTEALDTEGVWTSTNPDGETSTVERVEA